MKLLNALSCKLLASFLCMVIPGLALAQSRVIGTVTDVDGSPLPTATVLLLNPADSSLVKGGITDDDGRYHLQNIPSGTYILSISMVGFRKHYTDQFGIKDKPVRQEPIQLKESVEQLGVVSITARKPLFEQKIDRLVVNVQRNITSSGNSALEVLEKSPGVLINRQSNSVSLNGKTGIRIMINDKIVRLPIDAVVQMLDGMSAANIEQIELITTPPAKYEAEGDAGLINIKMKEHGGLGYNGTVGGNLGYNAAETLGGNFNFSHRGQKLAYFVNYSINYDNNESTWINRRNLQQGGFNELIQSDNHRDPTIEVQNIRLGMEYNLSRKTTAGVLLTGYRRKWITDDLSDNVSRLGPDSTLITQMSVRETNNWRRGIANLSVDHDFNEQQHLSVDFDYLYYKNDNPSFFRNNFVEGNREVLANDAIDVEKETPINIWVTKIDYEQQISPTFTISTGVKGTLSQFKNNVQVSDQIQGDWIVNSRLTNKADLTEKIGAAYLSGNWNPTEDLQVNGGVRYEYTDRLLSTPADGKVVDRSSAYLFPSLFIKRDLPGEFSIQGSYNRRITRPTFNDLAPFVFFVDPKTFLSGNSKLEPAISDGIKLDLQRKQWLISLQYSISNNEIAGFQPKVDPATNEQTYSAQNLDFLRTYAITTSFPLYPTSWWELQTNITGRYQRYRTLHLQDNLTLEAAGLTANITNTIELPRDFSFEISGFYQSKSIWGMMQFNPQGSVDAGVQKRINDGRGTIRLSMDDIFYTNVWEIDMEVPQANLDSFTRYDFHIQQVKLSFTWNFGNNELNTVSVESGSTEEQGRINTN